MFNCTKLFNKNVNFDDFYKYQNSVSIGNARFLYTIPKNDI